MAAPLEDVMKHQDLDKLGRRAVVLPGWLTARPMSKGERLERWAAALDREGDKQLYTLFEIEHMPRGKRKTMRADNSLLSVAFKDPCLRAEGLAGDTVGDVRAFFRISERELHDIACYCHHGPSMSARSAAARVRALATRPTLDARPLAVGACIALSLAAGALLI
jgi:hypothetical protein